jgi:hypothetical protein
MRKGHGRKRRSPDARRPLDLEPLESRLVFSPILGDARSKAFGHRSLGHRPRNAESIMMLLAFGQSGLWHAIYSRGIASGTF